MDLDYPDIWVSLENPGKTVQMALFATRTLYEMVDGSSLKGSTLLKPIIHTWNGRRTYRKRIPLDKLGHLPHIEGNSYRRLLYHPEYSALIRD